MSSLKVAMPEPQEKQLAEKAKNEAMEVAEAARETEWKHPSFCAELFAGRFRPDLLLPFPVQEEEDRRQGDEYLARVEAFLRANVDADEIDRTGEIPPAVIRGLIELGCFGMKIPREYGGLGFSQTNYNRTIQLIGSHCGSTAVWISAHQSIGVPQPLKLFGTEEQKRKYLPRLAQGEISAFALTEPGVGSDPANMETTAEPTPDGEGYLLNGDKLWCTNGTIAELLVVMARNPRTNAISAFVVETAWPGVEVTHRCRFMGLRALANAAIQFTDVKIPAENLIGKEGRGLKIALTTLNTGRLSLPAAVVGGSKVFLEICRKWSMARSQWGQEIGKHEAIAHKLAAMASTVYAMEAVSDLAQSLADKKGYDIRLEAAAAKEWNTVQAWRIIDDTMQIRGGRGYEKETSLAERGEAPVGVERAMRDLRINLIFEGSSEIMHLFMAREAVDKHLQIAGSLIDPKVPAGKKLAMFPRVGAFYASWYLGLWFRGVFAPRFGRFGKLARHLRFVERASRKLARENFHAMVRFGAAAERKQAFLFRLVDVANELLAMSASVSRAEALRAAGRPEAGQAVRLADHFCLATRRKVRALFRALWRNEDVDAYRLGREVLAGEHAWLEKGGMELGLTVEDLRPRLPGRAQPEPQRPAGPVAVKGVVA